MEYTLDGLNGQLQEGTQRVAEAEVAASDLLLKAQEHVAESAEHAQALAVSVWAITLGARCTAAARAHNHQP